MSSINIEKAKALVLCLENNEQQQANEILNELVGDREAALYEGLNELTHDLHETLDHLDDDSLLMQTKHDIPDATERLEYVLQTTEEASNNTLDKAEQALQSLEKLESQLSAMDADTLADLEQAKANLTEIMLAQSFQDLTGQVLNRVILIISSLEASLMQLIQNSKYDYAEIPDREKSAEDMQADYQKGVGPNVTKSSQQDVVASQDDVDSLLDDLGI